MSDSQRCVAIAYIGTIRGRYFVLRLAVALDNEDILYTMKKLALYGFGGHAREVAAQMGVDLVYFVDDQYLCEGALPISQFDPEVYQIMVAIADSQLRQQAVMRLPVHTEYFSFIHPSALLMSKKIEIGAGSFIGALSILTTDIRLGSHALLNRANQIGHDTVVGDFFSMMPGAIVGGNVQIGDAVYLGSGVNVREKIHIVDQVKIGLQSSVVKHIQEPGVYVGTPCRKIR